MNEKVKEALETLKQLDYYHLHSEGLKVIETALNKVEDYEIQNTIFKEHEKELIAEQHRLFDLAKEQEEALKIIIEKSVDIFQIKYWLKAEDYNDGFSEDHQLTQAEFDLVKKVVEKYGN